MFIVLSCSDLVVYLLILLFSVSCNAGQYRNSTMDSCTDCETNTYSAAGATSCTVCAAGTAANSGASQCGKKQSKFVDFKKM